MHVWHKRSFAGLAALEKVEFFAHGEDPNSDPDLEPRWGGPVEIKTDPAKPGPYDGGPDGQIVKVGSEHYVVRSDEYQAWSRQGGYEWDEIQLWRK